MKTTSIKQLPHGDVIPQVIPQGKVRSLPQLEICTVLISGTTNYTLQ